jgi:hypothetical protein
MHSRTLRFALLFAAIAFSTPAHSQAKDAQVKDADTSRPIVVKTPKETKPKNVKFIGEVVNSNIQSITVRSSDNERLIRTFTFSPELREKLQPVLDRGGYQYGDKVTIETQPNSDVALSIKGKTKSL